MKPRLDPSPVLFVIIVSLATTITGQNTRPYDVCGEKVECGEIDLEYPFWGAGRPSYCGHPGFQLTCQSNVSELRYESLNYRVLDTDTSAQTMKVARNDLWSNLCPGSLYNTTYDSTLFNGDNFNQETVSLYYACDTSPLVAQPFGNNYKFPCTVNNTTSDSYFIRTRLVVSTVLDFLVQCDNHIEVPVNQTSANILGSTTASSDDLQSALRAGFNLQWTVFNDECDDCIRSNGRCGSNSTSPELFVCYCASGNFSRTCDNKSVDEGGSKNSSLPIILGIVGAVVAIVVIVGGILCCRQRRKRRTIKEASPAQTETKAILTSSTVSSKYNFTSSIPSYPNSSKASKEYTKSSYFGTQVFTYEELEVATDNFNDSRELGDGGFGTVYYVDTNRHKLDINLANMAMTKIQNHMLDELVDKSIGFETNGVVRRMITLVAELAFRCLQQNKDMRPTMKEVVEILRGIQNDELNAQKAEVLDIVVDDGVLTKDHNTEPASPDFGVTNKLVGPLTYKGTRASSQGKEDTSQVSLHNGLKSPRKPVTDLGTQN
ncbi:protein kinase family protein [Artemisia annua]|uniref:non-specific serine/threonine protein kinase n=1 Tax=Artemisia annua TaxID=35608 RepID=A0A2U1KD80_ARTAN|nr:protein kinase family protein [Artemisia annua]